MGIDGKLGLLSISKISLGLEAGFLGLLVVLGKIQDTKTLRDIGIRSPLNSINLNFEVIF
ncbi:Uncharacterised protein [Chlamydia trachomatis]|nr:Uncharacterised protein [Chlamydia trachomatis]